MNQEQNRSPEPDAVEPGAAKGAPGKRRPRRSTSAPTRLKQAAALLHTAPAEAAPSPAGSPSRLPAPQGSGPDAGAAGTGPNRKPGTGPAPAGRNSGILPQAAAEDDPRAWGDSPEDTSAWLREQRPPHWG